MVHAELWSLLGLASSRIQSGSSFNICRYNILNFTWFKLPWMVYPYLWHLNSLCVCVEFKSCGNYSCGLGIKFHISCLGLHDSLQFAKSKCTPPIHSILHTINVRNVTPSFISQYPRKRMFSRENSLLVVTFLFPYISRVFTLKWTTIKEFKHTLARITLSSSYLLSLLQCWLCVNP